MSMYEIQPGELAILRCDMAATMDSFDVLKDLITARGVSLDAAFIGFAVLCAGDGVMLTMETVVNDALGPDEDGDGEEWKRGRKGR